MPPSTRPNVQSFEEGSVLRALRGAFRDPKPILTALGALGVSYGQAAFVDQRLGNVAWKSRDETGMNPNWVGILADFHRGRRAPPARRFQGRPALIDVGNPGLRTSIAARLVGTDTVEIGSALPYASPLHFGLPTQSPEITEGFQTWLYGLIQGARGAVAKAADAPEQRERKEVKAAQKADATLHRLRQEIATSKAAYAGRSVPKGERERVKALRTRLKAREAEVEREAVGRSESLTGPEAARYGAARARADGLEQLKWLLNPDLRGTSKTIKHPARPIVGVPPDMVKKAEQLLGVVIARAS